MDWQWLDLMPGDIVEVSPKICELYKYENWTKTFSGKLLEIIRIDSYNNYIKVWVRNNSCFVIDKITGEYYQKCDGGVPFFKIVSLTA